MPSDHDAACAVGGEAIFTCRQCGDCCRGYGGTYISREEMRSIAEYVGEDPDRFEEKYCVDSGGRAVLAQQENGFCVFWRERMCAIHPVKPGMCRAWPFIRSLLVDPGNWEKMASVCPGMRKGVPADVILRCVRAKRDQGEAVGRTETQRAGRPEGKKVRGSEVGGRKTEDGTAEHRSHRATELQKIRG